MNEPSVRTDIAPDQPITRRADHLAAGDAIASKMMPWTRRATEVVFTETYTLRSERRTIVLYRDEDGHRDSTNFRADALITLDRAADLTGQLYTRADDEPAEDMTLTPSGRRMPPHTGGMVGPVDSGQLVDETDPHILCVEEHEDGPCPRREAVEQARRERGGLIVGDTAAEQRDNAYAAYERDAAECPSAWHVNQGDKRSRCPICNQAD